MEKNELITNETIEKLKSLLNSFNGIDSHIDIYSMCIKEKLKEKLKSS